MNSTRTVEALEELLTAAEGLYASTDGGPAAIRPALDACDEALARVRRTPDRADELNRVALETAALRHAVADHDGRRVRAGANRIHASALVLLEPAWPATALHVHLARNALRAAALAAEEGRLREAARAVRVGRGAWLALGLEGPAPRSANHEKLGTVLALADEALRCAGLGLVLEGLRTALRLLRLLEADLLAGAVGRLAVERAVTLH